MACNAAKISKLTMNGGKSKFLWTLSMNALSCHRGSSSAVSIKRDDQPEVTGHPQKI
ncbi:hypothetical protein QJS10_CPA16g00493 [Acorus calamus]|uniref:Uncharacterized protein n=1 Tax=Acorus calamus TaxID=4465 RepID=A0AAV9D010_ACOCL|nr:hypothetical protein QJS10_CPA16g00493 [Acorus calamus]